MHAVFQERSYMWGALPELGLKEVFLKNGNLGNEEFCLLIYNLLSILPISLDWGSGENWMKTKGNAVVSTETCLAFQLPW